LTARGLVRVVEEGPRGSKTYDITSAGRDELRTWLLRPPGGGVVRNEGVLRMFLIPALDVEDQRAMLTAIAEQTAEGEARLRERLAHAPDPGRSPRAELGLLAGRFGLGQYRATHEWARRALEELDGPAEGDPPAVAASVVGRRRHHP
jgi:DNA-binding PadR family transcriptional regulator